MSERREINVDRVFALLLDEVNRREGTLVE